MCTSAPKAPPPVPDRSAARAPDGGDATARVQDRSKRRMGYAASILTGQLGTLGAPQTTNSGKALLGA